MKTLILHLDDRSTDFLKTIYSNLTDVTVLNVSQKSSFALARLIEIHDRLIFLGHGLPSGLIGYLTAFGSMVVVNAIRMKGDNVIYIWCNADQYVKKHSLSGFSTGMFISEFGESLYCKVENFNREEIEFQNNEFARLVGKYIDLPTKELRDKVYEEFNIPDSLVVEFNRSRLYYFKDGVVIGGTPPPQKTFKRFMIEDNAFDI